MIHLISRTLIERPVEQVFDFVSTPENDFQWQYGTLASARISEGTSQRGTSFRSIGHYLGYRVQGTFEVTEYETDRRYGFKSISGPWQSHTSYTFEVNNGSTQIDISTQVTMINFHQVSQGELEKDMKKQLNENLAMLKDLLEAGQVLPAPETKALVR